MLGRGNEQDAGNMNAGGWQSTAGSGSPASSSASAPPARQAAIQTGGSEQDVDMRQTMTSSCFATVAGDEASGAQRGDGRQVSLLTG